MTDAPTRPPAWQALRDHQRACVNLSLRELFMQNPARFQKFSLQHGDILFDYSKNLVTEDTLRLLADLARQRALPEWIERLFRGDRINGTEGRAALHTALRAQKRMMLDGRDVMQDVSAVLAQMRRFCEGVRKGRIRGATGRVFTDVVSIGIGGSDLGPRLVCEALAPYATDRLRVHFVSNVDGAAVSAVLRRLDAATTLVIIASKTFTTQETLANATTTKAWLKKRLRGEAAVARHFCAVTAAPERAVAFGIRAERVFVIWEWVGGRYSVWSAMGLPIVLAVGMKTFDALRAGARAMDEHFRSAPLERNMPAILGLLGVWYVSFCGGATHAVLPYDERLRLLPAYLQQLEMESCGKRATRDGGFADYATAPVVWGTAGTDGQHAYFQFLHQGTQLVAADFIACRKPHHRLRRHHETLLANFVAQTEALARGKTAEEAESEMRAQGLPAAEIKGLLPHRVFPGNRPSTSILLERLDPHALGALLALYEHKVFVESVIWNVNAFDQWGVELGKTLADRILRELGDTALVSSHDASTSGLINHIKAKRKRRKP